MSKPNEYPCAITRYGFRWGPVLISRMASDPKGGLSLQIQTRKAAIALRVTPKGTKIDVNNAPVYEWLWEEQA